MGDYYARTKNAAVIYPPNFSLPPLRYSYFSTVIDLKDFFFFLLLFSKKVKEIEVEKK